MVPVPPLEMPPLAPLYPQTAAAPPVVSTNVAAAMASLAKAKEEPIYTDSDDEYDSDEEKPREEQDEGKDWAGAEEDYDRE